MRTNSSSDLLSGLNPEQVRAVLHTQGPLMVLAGAGAGKTAVMTRRAFRLTAGVLDNRTQFTADATPAPGSTVTINGNTYSAAQVGTASATLDYGRRYEPYLGIGWGNLARARRGLTFGVDLGVVFTGAPTVSLQASNPTNDPALTADLASAQQTATTDVNSARYWPLIQMGIGYNF